MKRILTLCLALSLMLPLSAFGAEEQHTFTDVSPDDWFAPYVEVCVEEGLMLGTGEGKFSPYQDLTLAQVIVLAARLYSQTAEEEIPVLPLDEPLSPEDDLAQLWSFFVDADMDAASLAGLDPSEITAALEAREQAAISDFLDQLATDPSPYWYLNELYYLQEHYQVEMRKLLHQLKWQDGTAADTPATREQFGGLLGPLTPFPTVTRIPEGEAASSNQGVWFLVATGVMEGTGNGYELKKNLTRAECATMLARMMRPELRKTLPVEHRETSELCSIQVSHGSFGFVDTEYLLDLENRILWSFSADPWENEEERDPEGENQGFQTSEPLDPEALEEFQASSALQDALTWSSIYIGNAADGHQWRIVFTFSDGTTRELIGSNAYPESWDLLYDALIKLTGKNILEVRKDWWL